jgi:FkbM family methyltransferase
MNYALKISPTLRTSFWLRKIHQVLLLLISRIPTIHLFTMHDVTKWLYMKEIKLVLDIGANMGQYGVILRASGYSENIWSFEPVLNSYLKLEKKSKKDSKWSVYNYAVAGTSETKNFYVYDNFGMASSFSKPEGGRNELTDGTKIVETIELVPIKFSELLEKASKKFSSYAIKMDIQGFEGVLLNSVKLPTQVKVIQIEISIFSFYENTPDLTDIFHLLRDQEFKLLGFIPEKFNKNRELVYGDFIFGRGH